MAKNMEKKKYVERELDLCDYSDRDFLYKRELISVEVTYKGKTVVLNELINYFDLEDHYPEIYYKDGELRVEWKPVVEEETIWRSDGFIKSFKIPEWSDNLVCQIFPTVYMGFHGESGYKFTIRKKPEATVKVRYRYYGFDFVPAEIGYRREDFDEVKEKTY